MNKLQCRDLSIQKQEQLNLLDTAAYLRDKWELDPVEYNYITLQIRQQYEKTVTDIINNK